MNLDIYKACIKLTCKLTQDQFANIGRKLAEDHPAIFLALHNDESPHTLIIKEIYSGFRDHEGVWLNPRAINQHNKVAAMRYHRSITDTSLKQSKDYIEFIIDKYNLDKK